MAGAWSAIRRPAGSKLGSCHLTRNWAGGCGLRELAWSRLRDLRLAWGGIRAFGLARGGLLALAFVRVGLGARRAGVDGAVSVGGEAGRAAQDGVARPVAGWTVAGWSVGDGGHVWLPVGDGCRADRAADGAADGTVDSSAARGVAGTGYVESSPAASWLADGRCRRGRTATRRLVGGRWARNRITADGMTAPGYIGGFGQAGNTDTGEAGAGLQAGGRAGTGDPTGGLLTVGGTRGLARPRNAADGANTDGLADQGHTPSRLAAAGA